VIAIPRGRLPILALLGCMGFIAYQSLAAGGAWRCDGPVLQVPSRLSRADVVVNVAGYLPFGFLYVLACATRRQTWPSVAVVLIAWGSGICLSATLEAMQACQTARISSIADVVANATGTLLGALVAVALTRLMPARVDVPRAPWRPQRLPLVTLGVPALWIVLQTLPWVFSLDVGVIRANLSFLRHWQQLPLDLWSASRHAAAWGAIACACGLAFGNGWRALAGVITALGTAVGLQLMTQTSRPLSFSELAGMGLAFVATGPLLMLRSRRAVQRTLAVTLAGLATMSLVAFELEPGTGNGGRTFQWLPQVGLSRPLDLLDFAVLFGWLGLAVTVAAHWYARDSHGLARRVWPTLAVSVTIACEIAQIWIPGRGPDVSPPLLTGLAALAATVALRDAP